MKVVLGLLLAFSFISCTHKTNTEEPRQPASAEISAHKHLSVADSQKMEKMVKDNDERTLNQILISARIVQTMASSFDERLTFLKTQADADRLLNSQLYCRIMDLRSLQEKVDEKLRHAFQVTQKNPEARAWLLKRIARFSNEGPKSEAAMINLLRTVRPLEIQFCGSAHCLEKELAAYKFNVAPFDDEAFAVFMKKNRKNIAKYSGYRPQDLNPGLCFGEARKPNQTQGFDWKNRNWVGSVLPEGHFAFTYDDGPDPRYTRAIRDIWAKAGLAKPAFFWTAKQAILYPEIVKELYGQGYIIGSHSWHHPDIGSIANANSVADLNTATKTALEGQLPGANSDFAAWKAQQIETEIGGAMTVLEQITGQKIKFFRLPYGSGVRNDIVSAHFERHDLDHFFWRIDSLDWQDKNPVSVRDRVLTQMATVKKGIILFHDFHPQSVQASELLAEHFKQNPQLKAVTLKEIPGLENK